MAITEIDYTNKEQNQQVKHALALASMRLHFPGDPAYNQDEFLEYIALQYHLAQYYLGQEQTDLLNAIRLAEQARMDMLRIPGMWRYDPRIRPFYALLSRIYDFDVINPKPGQEISPAQNATNKAIAAKYKEFYDTIPPAPVGTPPLPDVDLEKFTNPKLIVPKDKANDPSAGIRVELKRTQAVLYERQAKEFLGIQPIDARERSEFIKAVIESHRAYGTAFVLQKDLMNTINHGKRAEALALEQYSRGNDIVRVIFSTLAANFVQIASLIVDVSAMFSVEAAYYHTLANDTGLPSSPGVTRARSGGFYSVT